ncbi:hypothetical protein NL676_008529 [Syzygium grande]|nr:hypothetical protein NL676_008529 [Syzygium grande]
MGRWNMDARWRPAMLTAARTVRGCSRFRRSPAPYKQIKIEVLSRRPRLKVGLQSVSARCGELAGSLVLPRLSSGIAGTAWKHSGGIGQ